MSYIHMTIPNPATIGLKIPEDVSDCVRGVTQSLAYRFEKQEEKLMALSLALFVACSGQELKVPDDDE
jgi:hypothetical protein